MDRVNLPNTTLSVSSICLGTSELGAVVAKDDAFALLDTFVELGGNFLDTALVYADWIPGERSVSEKTIGAWMRARSNQDDIVVATKGAHPDLATMHVPRMSPGEIRADVEASLANLQVERIDLYYLHRDDVMRPVEEIMATLQALVRAGKLRYVACSNWCAGRVEAAQAYAKAQGFEGFVANQMLWNLAVVNTASLEAQGVVAMDRDLRRFHVETGMAAIPFSSQAGGLFHKMALGTLGEASTSLDGTYPLPQNTQRFARIEHMAAETGLRVSEIVMAYLLSQPFVTVPVVGCKTQAHLRDTVAAAKARLDPLQIAFLERGEHATGGICPA